VAQVESDGMGAQEDLSCYLSVAETGRHEVGDPALGVGHAVPAVRRPRRPVPVVQPDARAAQLGADARHPVAVAEPLVHRMGLPHQGHGVVVAAAGGGGQGGVLGCGSACELSRVAARHLLKQGRIALDQAADMQGRRRDSGIPRTALR
jgi:hypothetical protein